MKTLIIALILLPATSFAGAFNGFGGYYNPNQGPNVYDTQQQQQAEQRERQRQLMEQNQIRFNSVTGPNGQRYNCMTVPLGNFSQTTCN